MAGRVTRSRGSWLRCLWDRLTWSAAVASPSGRGGFEGAGSQYPELIQSAQTRLSTLLLRTGRLTHVFPAIQQGPRIQDPLPRLQTPASMHLCLHSPSQPLPLSPPVIGAVPSLVTRPQDRGRLVSLRCLWWGNQGPERQSSKIAQGVSDGV